MKPTTIAVFALFVAACDRIQPLEPIASPNVRAAAPPSHTSAVAMSASRIDVSWQDNSSNERGFEVHRSTTGPSGAFALLASTGAGVTSYSDVGLSAATQYCYKVRAFRTTGNTTSYSEFPLPACATTLASAPPPAPPAPRADIYPQGILLFWFDNSTNEDGFKIERCQGVACSDPDFIVIATIGPYNWFLDPYVESGTTYSYRVRAFNSAGDSAPSDPVSATMCFVEVSEEGYFVCSGF